MNKYFKPLDWEINDYIIHINEPSTIDLSPYLNYIIPDKIEEEKHVSNSEEEGGVKKAHVPYLTPKEELPKYKHIDLPKSDIEGNSNLLLTDDDFDNPKSFVNRFYNIYVSRGVNPELAEILSVQKLLESRKKDGKGFTNLAKEFNNFGGIKAGKDSTDYYSSLTDEYMDGVKKRVVDKFRKFDSVSDYLDYESKYIYGNRGNFNGALSGDVDHYFDIILNRKLKYATAPDYKDYLIRLRDQYFGVKSSKHGGILKAQHGVLLDSYTDPKHYYDYSNGEYDEETGHWYSRNPDTGLELKHPNHPTNKIGQYYDKKEGLKRFRNKYNGRYYTLEDWNSGRFIPGMEEVDYDLIPNPFDDRIGRYMDGHTKEDEYDRWIGYSDIIKRASKEFGVPEKIMIHLGSTESHFNPDSYNKSTGASGIYQITPESLQWFKDKGHWREDYDDVENNIRAGAFLLRYFKNRYKDWDKALMGYKGIDPSIINNPNHPEYNSRRINNKIDYLINYIK